MQIWKYDMRQESHMMPIGATVLTAQTQRGNIFIWAMVDPNMALVERKFEVVGTGHDFNGGIYIGTAQVDWMVFHVFEVTDK